MSKPKSVTQKTFSPHVLAVLGELTNHTAGVAVQFTETYAPVCARMGITEDQHGQCETHGKPWTHRLIGLAFRGLRDKGLGEYVTKGQWALTPAGVQHLSKTDKKAQAVPTAQPEVVESVCAVAKVQIAPQTNTKKVVQLPSTHPYHNDPYVRALAIRNTPCFGSVSPKNDTCKVCPFLSECQQATLAAKSKIAQDLLAEETAAMAIAAAKAKAKANKTESIDDLINSFDDKSPRKAKPAKGKVQGRPAKATAQRDAKCEACAKMIKKETTCIWVNGVGLFHDACYSA